MSTLDRRFAHPCESGEEGEEDAAEGVGLRELEGECGLAPAEAHVGEGQEVEGRPHRREARVRDHVVLPRLDRRHLLEEPGKTDDGRAMNFLSGG